MRACASLSLRSQTALPRRKKKGFCLDDPSLARLSRGRGPPPRNDSPRLASPLLGRRRSAPGLACLLTLASQPIKIRSASPDPSGKANARKRAKAMPPARLSSGERPCNTSDAPAGGWESTGFPPDSSGFILERRRAIKEQESSGEGAAACLSPPPPPAKLLPNRRSHWTARGEMRVA